MTINRRFVCFSVCTTALLTTVGCGSGNSIRKSFTNAVKSSVDIGNKAITAIKKTDIDPILAESPIGSIQDQKKFRCFTFQHNGEKCYDIRFTPGWLAKQKFPASSILEPWVIGNGYNPDGTTIPLSQPTLKIKSVASIETTTKKPIELNGYFSFVFDGTDFHAQVSETRIRSQFPGLRGESTIMLIQTQAVPMPSTKQNPAPTSRFSTSQIQYQF